MLASALSQSRGFFNRANLGVVKLRRDFFRRDAETNARDARTPVGKLCVTQTRRKK